MNPNFRISLRKALFCCGLCCLCWLSTQAAERRLKEFSIVVADEYSEVVRHEKTEDGVEAVYYSFVAPARNDGTQTHLQVSVMRSEKITKSVRKNSPLSPDALRSLSDKILLEMANGIEKRREKFKRTNPADFTAGKHVFRRLDWTGTVGGREMSGRAYGTLVGDHFYFFAIQDFKEHVESSFKKLEPSLEHFKPVGAKL